MKSFSGKRVPQREHEIDCFAAILKAQGVKSYLEIGARYGDSLHYIGSALARGSRIAAVDLPGGPWGNDDSQVYLEAAARDLKAKGRPTEVILGASTADATLERVRDLGPFDAIFIDGDHTAEGVKADWKAYRSLGRIIAFHDIDVTTETVGKRAGRFGVAALWRRLKADHPHVEIIDRERGMGIGVLWRPAA